MLPPMPDDPVFLFSVADLSFLAIGLLLESLIVAEIIDFWKINAAAPTVGDTLQ